MTDPKMAISEEKHGLYGAGRLYGVPGFDVSTLMTPDDVREALREKLLMPSVTNVIGLYPKDHLQGWYGREAAKTLGSAHQAVDEARGALLAEMVSAGASIKDVSRCARQDIPPNTALARFREGILIPDDLALEADNWVRAASYALTNSCSVRDLELILTGASTAPVRKNPTTFFGDMKRGKISQTEHDRLVGKRRVEVIRLMRGFGDANWLYTRLANETSGVALLGLAAERQRDGASYYGDQVHNLVENLTIDPDFEHDGEYDYHVDGWRSWMDDYSPTDLHPELSVLGETDDGLPFGGTADLFAKVDGVGTVIDYKTSKTLSESTVSLQMSALAYANTVPFDIEHAIALHLPRKADAERLWKYKPKGDLSYSQYKKGYRAFELDKAAMADGWAVFSAARRLWQELYVHGSKH
jgi:hypothetical protein